MQIWCKTCDGQGELCKTHGWNFDCDCELTPCDVCDEGKVEGCEWCNVPLDDCPGHYESNEAYMWDHGMAFPGE